LKLIILKTFFFKFKTVFILKSIKTLENVDWCVQLTSEGYSIVSNEFDKINLDSVEKTMHLHNFETCEALMGKISPLYVEKFNDLVAQKLKQLK
jgi:hypothetical protein